MESKCINDFILNIFELNSEILFFPVSSQRVCKRIVNWLHEDGVSYGLMSKEIGEDEKDFMLWRKGLVKQKIGKKVIDRLNKPFNDFLASVESVDDDSYEAIFEDENSQNFSRDILYNSRHSDDFKNKKITKVLEEEYSEANMNNNEIIDYSSGKIIIPTDCKYPKLKPFVEDSIKPKTCDNLIQDIIDSLMDEALKEAMKELKEKLKAVEHCQKKRICKILSSDSFKSCTSSPCETSHPQGEDRESLITNDSFDSFEEPHDKTSYFDSTRSEPPTNSNDLLSPSALSSSQNLHGCIYLFTQPLHTTHRFKLGATTDLQSVKAQAMQYNLDLSLVASHEVTDVATSLQDVSAGVGRFKINAFNWFEGEYSRFMLTFEEAIKECN